MPHVVHAKRPEAGEQPLRGRTCFGRGGVAQLLVERLWDSRPEVEAAVPDGRDLTQVELALFVLERQTLFVALAVKGCEAHLGRVTVCVETNRPAALPL